MLLTWKTDRSARARASKWTSISKRQNGSNFIFNAFVSCVLICWATHVLSAFLFCACTTHHNIDLASYHTENHWLEWDCNNFCFFFFFSYFIWYALWMVNKKKCFWPKNYNKNHTCHQTVSKCLSLKSIFPSEKSKTKTYIFVTVKMGR